MKAIAKITKILNYILGLVATNDMSIVKRSGQYLVVEELKMFGLVVETTETKVKDIVIVEEK